MSNMGLVVVAMCSYQSTVVVGSWEDCGLFSGASAKKQATQGAPVLVAVRGDPIGPHHYGSVLQHTVYTKVY